VSARTITRGWVRRAARGRIGNVVRQLGGHAELEERLARLEAELHDVRVHAGRADDAIARLTEGLAATSSTFEHDLAEARRLSHRVAQMTDVVFDRLAERSGDQPA
jgi:uncharacterized small protein (DUF1192 family)